jgi:KaiC/GvpD/RAD55 family RecA-like ATPase
MSDLQSLVDKSPVRVFEKAVGDSLGVGEAGLITSKKGLGKTAVLVQFGVDALLQDKEIVHASFNQKSANVIGWYESIFTEIAKKKNIPNASDVLAEVVRKRTILNLNQDVVSLARIVSTVKALAASGIKINVLLIDDIDFAKVKPAEVDEIHAFAKNEGITVWMSAAYDSGAAIPASIHAHFDVSLHLDSKSDAIELTVLKLHGKEGLKLKLDSKTLLFTEK